MRTGCCTCLRYTRTRRRWKPTGNAPHYLKWREECADWFATENVRRLATPVYPPPEKWEKRPPVD